MWWLQIECTEACLTVAFPDLIGTMCEARPFRCKAYLSNCIGLKVN